MTLTIYENVRSQELYILCPRTYIRVFPMNLRQCKRTFKFSAPKILCQRSLAYRPSQVRSVWLPPHTTSRVAAVVISFPTDLENYMTARPF